MHETNAMVTSRDGTTLYVIDLRPDEPNGRTVVIVHGYHEYGTRYRGVAEAFTSAGYRVVLPDLRGHGYSAGARGHVMSWDEYQDDIDAILDYTGCPPDLLGLLGHSNGGLVVASFVLDRPGRVAAAAMSSPLMGLSLVPPAWKVTAGRVLSRWLPKVSFPTEVAPEDTCRSPEVVAAFEADPVCFDVVNSRWYTESTAAIARAMERARHLDVPMLILQGGDDLIVDAKAVSAFAERAGAEYREIPDAYHELMFDPGGQTHAVAYREWFDRQLHRGLST